MLCSRLIEHASSISLPFPPAYFFFSSEHESHSDPYVAIRFWIRQIVSQNDTTFRMAAMQAEAETGQEASRSSLVRLLNDIVHAVSGYTLIADGLDECAIRVRDFLFDIKMAIKGSNTRILIASRHQSSIHDSLIADNEGINFAELRILPEDTQADILAYSNSIVSQKLSQKPQDTQHEISKVMVDRCQGQFLWMKLQSDSLRNTLSKKQLQKAISNTPSGIMRVYERSWQKVMDMPERDRNRAIDLLRWVVFATRPMNVGEIIEAVQVDMNDHGGLPFDPDELPDFMDEEYVNSEITALCQSFVEIRPPASAPSTDLLQSTVHLTHFTVREFLLSTVNPSIPSHMAPATQGKAGIFAVASAEHGNLARRCLHFIILSMALEERPGNSAAPDFMFKDYAGRWWYRHYQDMDKDEVASRLAQELFNHDHPCWARWSTMFEESHILETLIRSGGPASGPLCFASVLGLADLVSHLLEHGHQVNDRWRGGVSALEMASYRGRNQVVSVLLTAGARADGAGADGRRAIHYAVAGGRHETAKILIQGGADINTRDQQGATALLRAAELGDAAMVRLLIESRADTKVRQETDGWVPLHSAAQNGHLEVARMLLARSRAEIHLKTNEGHTPLTLSAREGRDMLVKLLIDSGARVNDKDNYGWMPLHHAAFHGRLVASDLLINAGADMNSKNSFNNFSPLGHALHFKNWEVAKLIIGAGADVNQWIDDSQQPLHYASVEGLLDITEALITAGADVHAKGRLNWTALHYAARNGHQTVSDLLIKAGADINATGQSGWTPLHVAAFYGHIHISDFLVKSGANLNVESIGGKLPIHYALLHEHWEIVRLLSTAGLNI